VQVVVLTKAPAPGQVKTRLAAQLGEGVATALHEAMVRDLVDLLASEGLQPEWHVAGQPGPTFRAGLPGTCTAQVEGDLGARIAAALGSGPAVALGTDAPTLPPPLLRRACASTADVVLGPAFDGGCWCIGWSRPQPGLLEEMAWSDHRVFAELVTRARARHLVVDVLPFWYDVDLPEDLVRLVQQLRTLPETVARNTRRWIRNTPEDLCPR